jgi:arylsulfatase A-like enzyme
MNNIKLPQEEVGIAQVLGPQGYVTQYIGKWHLDGPTPDPLEDPGWVTPEDRQGFKQWLAFNYGHTYYGGKYYSNRDATVRTTPEGQYEPDFQTKRALQFIARNRHRQFCVFLSIGPPHPPTMGAGRDALPPGGAYQFPYDPDAVTLRPNVDYPDADRARRRHADYYGIISNFDWNVGRIQNRLEALGLADNTILVVTSDHGDTLGSHSDELGPFRAKRVIYAESLDVPFILRYPQMVAPTVVNDVFTSVDIMPTLLGLCGLPVPRGVMGRDFSPLISSGEEPSEPPSGPVPSTEAALVGMFGGTWVGIRSPEYSLECARDTLVPTKLYHNTLDPYQMTNLVDDPDYQTVEEALYQDLLAWLDFADAVA